MHNLGFSNCALLTQRIAFEKQYTINFTPSNAVECVHLKETNKQAASLHKCTAAEITPAKNAVLTNKSHVSCQIR